MRNNLVPQPGVAVEYDRAGQRVVKGFDQAHQAKRFYEAKAKAGKNPKIKALAATHSQRCSAREAAAPQKTRESAGERPSDVGKASSSTAKQGPQRTARKSPSRVAVYVRVSTLDQQDGLASQEQAIKSYLAGHGITGAVWFRDRITGATTKRPAFERMQQAIFNGQVKTVVCWKLDRLSRSLRDGVNTLCDWLNKGVQVVAISQQLDFSGSVGQMVAGVLFAVAQMERENLRENTKRGLAAAKARGVKLGKRPKLFAKDILALLDSGMSLGAVARQLQVSRTAVYKALARAGKSRTGEYGLGGANSCSYAQRSLTRSR